MTPIRRLRIPRTGGAIVEPGGVSPRYDHARSPHTPPCPHGDHINRYVVNEQITSIIPKRADRQI
jgi:hypothetical protein